MTRLYFVRHGLTVNNQLRCFNGSQANPKLLPVGQSQAKKLGEHLAGTVFTQAYASPQRRAVETAQIILQENPFSKPELIQEPLLKEIGFGSWDNTSYEEKVLHPQMINLRRHPERYDPQEFGGETYPALIQRGRKFLESLDLNEFGNYLIVGHGVMLTTLLQTLRGKEVSQIRESGILANTSLTMFDSVDGHSFDEICWNYQVTGL